MPTTPYAKILVRVNAGAPTSGGITVAVGDTIELSAESTVGWGSPAPVWELYGFPPSYACPTGWTTVGSGDEAVYRFTGLGPPPSFDIDVWGKYMLALRVNGGGGQLTDETTALSALSISGLEDLGAREAAQFGGTNKRWVKAIAADLRLLDGAVGGSVTDVLGTAPIVVVGGVVKTVSITPATGLAAGSMSPTHFTLLNDATAAPSAGMLGKRGASGELGAAWFYGAGTVAGSGLVRAANNMVIVAAKAGGAGDLFCVTTDGSDNIIVGPDPSATTGQLVLRTRSSTTFTVGLSTVASVGSTLWDFLSLVRLPAIEPTAVRQVGAEAGGRLRLFVGGAATSSVVESDVTTSTPYATKILRRGSSGEAEAAWFQAGAAADVAVDGHLRLPDAGLIAVKGDSGTILLIEHETGSDNVNLLIGVDNAFFAAQVANFANPIFLPLSDPTAARLFGAEAGGRLRMYVDSAPRSAAIVPLVTATKTSAYTAAWDETVRVDPTGGAFTVALTTAAGNAGRIVVIANVSDSPTAVTVDGAGAETISGAANIVIAEPRGVLILQSDGTNVINISRQARSRFDFGSEGIGTTATTRYLPVGSRSGTATTGIKVLRVPKPCVVSSITYAAGTAGTGTGTYTFTLFRRVAGSPVLTAIAVTVLATATTGRADFTPIVLAADDEIGIQVTNAGTVTGSPTDAQIAVE